MKRVFVAAPLAAKPGSGGPAWVWMSWARGLARLGLDVWLVEEGAVDDPAVRWFERVVARFGLGGRAALVDADRGVVSGPCAATLRAAARDAVLVNISGNLRAPALFETFRRRVYLDLDPGFTQFWHAAGLEGASLAGHDDFFTVGELIGTPRCSIPTSGIDWRPVRQPVLLDDWPVVTGPTGGRFTTVASWRPPFGPVEHEGRRYGLKVHEFRRFIELPRRSTQAFELALDIHPADDADRMALLEHGWRLADPREVAGDVDAFRSYVQRSGAEFSVAQGVYVDTRSGWFSDRTVRYLASGRPALVQDTGFSETLPVGEGLVPFGTLDEAVAGAADIAARSAAHSAAARRIAETCFAHDAVLPRFCADTEIA